MKKYSLFPVAVLMVCALCSCKGEEQKIPMPDQHKTEEFPENEIRIMEEEPVHPEREVFMTPDFGLTPDESRGYILNEPKDGGTIIGHYEGNTGMRVVSDVNDYLQVESGYVVGYIKKDQVLQGSKAREQLKEHKDYWAEIQTEYLNVRLKPDTESAILALVKEGQHYQIVDEEKDFFKINLGFCEGYISKEFSEGGYTSEVAETYYETKDLNKLSKKAIEFGMKYLGNPYVYGGTSMTNGCDCSYFTAMCMYQSGVIVGRTSRDQAKRGREISVSELRAGDLIFYKVDSDEINHVAIYIGDGKVIQAAESRGCICISAYNYCGEPCMARRYFEAAD